eukprot:6201280-Pleurochrysis_carterae.AAC.5
MGLPSGAHGRIHACATSGGRRPKTRLRPARLCRAASIRVMSGTHAASAGMSPARNSDADTTREPPQPHT